MSENKYDYLVGQWKNYISVINTEEKNVVDQHFGQFIDELIQDKLTLERFAKPTDEDSSYLCNFIERTSSKFYGSAKPGNMYNYGISYIAEKKDKYFIHPSLIDEEIKGESYKKERKKEVIVYNYNDAEKIFNLKIKPYIKKLVEEKVNDELTKIIKDLEGNSPIFATHFLRKIVAMNNPGSFIYAYSDESINTIYDFFIGKDKNKSNIEKNFEVTKIMKQIFQDFEKKDESVYMIQLSKFIWSIFGTTINIEAKNIILHGAPGTGKTYSIKNTVKNIILKEGGSLANQLVFTQFHPSYGYEDFIDGIKPNGIDKDSGQLILELKNGNFKELCRKASLNLKESRINNTTPHTFYFIADEINRAELSRVFGELLISLEEGYRIDFDSKGNLLNEENLITLQNAILDKKPVHELHGKNYFGVPSNLYFIGTMNDIDRSVDSFDMALRRRFYWKEIRCNYDYIESVVSDGNGLVLKEICKNLNRFITGFKEEKSNGKLEKVTSKIKGKEPLRLGTSFELGHAYFKDLNEVTYQSLNKLWESKIEPLLYEYLRAEYSQDEIYTKLMEAKEIFSLPNSETND